MYISDDSNEKRTNGKEDDVVSLESSGNTNGTGDNTKDKAKYKTKEKTPKSKKAKTTSATSIERSMAFMAEQSKRKTDIFEQHVAASATLIAAKIEAVSKKMDTTSLTECMEIMQGMDIDEIQFARGINRVHATPILQSLFLKMNDQRKREWLNNPDL
ncbi:hypothetical protein LINGRAHAP2_LOCUS6965 [Linum grandiflorum]